jgi:hypothetical protein
VAKKRAYSVYSQSNVANATKTAAGLTSGSTSTRPYIYDLWVGSDASPADNAIDTGIQRYTAAGTAGGAYTPPPIDPGDPACLSTAGTGQYSGEPTYTSGKILLYLALNQRATHRIQLDPDAPLMIPATSNNGLGIYPVHASFTGEMVYTFHFAE